MNSYIGVLKQRVFVVSCRYNGGKGTCVIAYLIGTAQVRHL